MNIMHQVRYGLKIEKANWQDICINKKRNGMIIPIAKYMNRSTPKTEQDRYIIFIYLYR